MARLELSVRVSGVVVGRLDRNREGRVRFLLDEAWLAGGQLPRLGLAFLRAPGPRLAGTGMPVWFEGLLPPSESALRARVCHEWGIRDGDSAALLAALGRDLPGAVEVSGEAEPNGAPTDAPTERLMLGFSLAGMQLKFSMSARDGGFAAPARDQDGAWIVKVPGAAFRDLPRVEHTTMAWARAMGLPVPDCRVVPREAIDGVSPDVFADVGEALAIRRFDRASHGHRRVHQEDFAQALEVHPSHQYGDTGGQRTSADLVGRLVLDVCGVGGAHDYVDRLAFVIASGNGDAHLKNHSWQWLEGSLRPTLSPLYDQVSTVAWPERFGWATARGPSLALAIGQTRAFRALTIDRIHRFQERSRIPDAERRLLAALERARASWAEVRHSAPESMRSALRDHWRHTPLLRDLGELP